MCPCNESETICCRCRELLCCSFENFCVRQLHILEGKMVFCPECYAEVRELKKIMPEHH